ncbi:hypothetical protein [Amycolatopsis regifaucium]|nr:hypothetical protein [Amycolatopsis regifaucium]
MSARRTGGRRLAVRPPAALESTVDALVDAQSSRLDFDKEAA